MTELASITLIDKSLDEPRIIYRIVCPSRASAEECDIFALLAEGIAKQECVDTIEIRVNRDAMTTMERQALHDQGVKVKLVDMREWTGPSFRGVPIKMDDEL